MALAQSGLCKPGRSELAPSITLCSTRVLPAPSVPAKNATCACDLCILCLQECRRSPSFWLAPSFCKSTLFPLLLDVWKIPVHRHTVKHEGEYASSYFDFKCLLLHCPVTAGARHLEAGKSSLRRQPVLWRTLQSGRARPSNVTSMRLAYEAQEIDRISSPGYALPCAASSGRERGQQPTPSPPHRPRPPLRGPWALGRPPCLPP